MGICCETHKSETVISIGYISSRFKSKLCMVLSHTPQPFDQQALTVRLHFESWLLKILVNTSSIAPKVGLSISHSTLHLRAKELTTFRYAIFLAVGAMQPPPSSADSAWFLTQDSGFGTRRTTTDDGRNRANPNHPFQEQKIAKVLSPKTFNGDFKQQEN